MGKLFLLESKFLLQAPCKNFYFFFQKEIAIYDSFYCTNACLFLFNTRAMCLRFIVFKLPFLFFFIKITLVLHVYCKTSRICFAPHFPAVVANLRELKEKPHLWNSHELLLVDSTGTIPKPFSWILNKTDIGRIRRKLVNLNVMYNVILKI